MTRTCQYVTRELSILFVSDITYRIASLTTRQSWSNYGLGSKLAEETP
jgi:hypothetical protein